MHLVLLTERPFASSACRDQNLFPPTLHTSSPIYAYLSCIQTHGKPSLVPGCASRCLIRLILLVASTDIQLTAGLTDGLKGKQTQKALDKLASSFAAVRGRVYGEFLVRTSKAVTLIGGGHKLVGLARRQADRPWQGGSCSRRLY